MLETLLIDPDGDLFGAFLALGLPVDEIFGPVAGELGELHQLLHHVHNPVLTGGLHPARIVKFKEGLRSIW